MTRTTRYITKTRRLICNSPIHRFYMDIFFCSSIWIFPFLSITYILPFPFILVLYVVLCILWLMWFISWLVRNFPLVILQREWFTVLYITCNFLVYQLFLKKKAKRIKTKHKSYDRGTKNSSMEKSNRLSGLKYIVLN
jgi:uncharacterized membrane protein YbjE (DUF340 family)